MAISGHAIDRWKKENHTQASLLSTLFGLVVLAGVVVFLVIDSKGESERLVSALGQCWLLISLKYVTPSAVL